MTRQNGRGSTRQSGFTIIVSEITQYGTLLTQSAAKVQNLQQQATSQSGCGNEQHHNRAAATTRKTFTNRNFNDYSPLLKAVNTSFSCWVARINVVLLLSSFSFDEPTYVHVERTPPRMSKIVFSTGPRYSISTVFPSEALQFQHICN